LSATDTDRLMDRQTGKLVDLQIGLHMDSTHHVLANKKLEY